MNVYHLGAFTIKQRTKWVNERLIISLGQVIVEVKPKEKTFQMVRYNVLPSLDERLPLRTPDFLICEMPIYFDGVFERKFLVQFETREFAFLFFCVRNIIGCVDLIPKLTRLLVSNTVKNYDKNSVIHCSNIPRWVLRGETGIVGDLLNQNALSNFFSHK